MKFSEEKLKSVKKEVKPLLESHWHEIALNKDHIKLNPDWNNYHTLEKIGALRIYTARTDEGKLVGYFVVIMSKSLHYKDHMFANNDIIFISKEYRKGLTGLKFIKYACNKLRSEGVTLLNINTKVHHDFGKVMSRIGFNHIEDIYSINLKV